MKKFSKILVFSVLAVFLMAGSAWATPFDPSTLASTSTQLDGLQGIFDGITSGGSSSIDVYNDETQDEVFSPGTDTTNNTYVATATWDGGDFIFGYYEFGDTTNKLELFDTSKVYGNIGESIKVYIDYGTDYMESYYFDASNNIQSIQTTTSMEDFGFYVLWSNNTWYSESNLNPNSYDRFLTYPGEGDSVDADSDGTYLLDNQNWYVAGEIWDDTNYDPTTGDYTDVVVQIESINPVSEPATMLLLGSALMGLAALGRKKFIKK